MTISFLGQPSSCSTGRYAYDLSAAQTELLTQRLLRTSARECSDRFACFEIEGTDPLSDIGRQVEREVFQDSFGNDPEMLANEYRPYEDSSVFFLAVDTAGAVPAGVMRMIRHSAAGHKTLIDMQDPTRTPTPVRIDEVMRCHGIDLDKCWDGASACVRRPFRRRLATIHVQLARAWYGAAKRENIEHLVSILDAPVYRMTHDFLRVPLVPLVGTPPFTYMDAPDHQAVYCHIPTALAFADGLNRRLGQRVRDCVEERNPVGGEPFADLRLPG